MKKKVPAIMAIIALFLVASLRAADAEPQFIYSCKFLCGLQTQDSSLFPPPQEPSVKPGNYATAINVHNFHRQGLVFTKKVVIALPERQQERGQVTKPVRDRLGPNQALEVDCTDIVKLLPPPSPTNLSSPSFIKGFVEIVSAVKLSVTGVYTAQTCLDPQTTATSTGPFCSRLGELQLEVVPQSAFREEEPGRGD